MSENEEGLPGRTVKEEEESMHEALDKRIFNDQSSNFLNPDDELLSWLQYPIDDDMFHHLPPPLTTSPALPAPADFFLSPSFPLSTLSSTFFSSSSFAVKHLPQLNNDAFMVAKDSDRRGVVDDWILHKEDIENENFQGEQTTALKNKGVLFGQGTVFGMKDHNEAYHLENRGDRRAEIWANRILDCKQGFAKDSRNLAHLKLTPKEEKKGWAPREARVAALKGVPHPMHSSLQNAMCSNKEEDTNMMLTTHSPKNQEERGIQRRAEAQEEKLLQFGQASTEVCWLENNMDMQLDTKERAPMIGRFQTLSNVDAALALGAGRAAGIIKPPGVEAFSKIRTSLQPTQHVPLGSPALSSGFSLSNVRTSLQPIQHVFSGSSAFSSSFPTSRILSDESLFGPAFPNWMSTPLRPVGSSGSTPVSQLSYQTGETKLHNPAQLHVPEPSAGFSDMESHKNQFNFQEKIRTIQSNTTKAFSLEPSPRVALLSPQDTIAATDGTHNVSIPEDLMAGVSGGTATSDWNTTDMQKLSSVSFLSQEITAGTRSGGSQTSGSLKESVSGLKRKLEDSECLSEEADEDSVVSSQTRTSISKRPRANEVHNLSERRRRNRINDKMNALRELIPNASKSNKAALLDEAIDYLKNLQLQLQVMSLRTGVSLLPVVLPPSMPHMPIPQYRPCGSMEMDLSGGSALANAVPTMSVAKNKTHAVPARPFGPMGSVSGSLISTDLRPFQPLAANHSFSQFQGLPAHAQPSSQINFTINSNICNSPQIEQQRQQQQQPQLPLQQPQEHKEEELQQQHQQ